MNITVLRSLHRRLRQEEGAVALLTISFLTFLGFVLVTFLWTIGYAGGAYNALQNAAQAGAYAAVGSTVTTDEENPRFICKVNGLDRQADDSSNNGLCDGGTTFDVAKQAVQFTLTHTKANFGMNLDKGVQFADPLNKTPSSGIYAYEVATSTASGRQLDPECKQPFHQISSAGPQRVCWIMPRNGAQPQPQQVSGVVVSLVTEVQLPGCVAKMCKQPIYADGAAAQAQDETQPY